MLLRLLFFHPWYLRWASISTWRGRVAPNRWYTLVCVRLFSFAFWGRNWCLLCYKCRYCVVPCSPDTVENLWWRVISCFLFHVAKFIVRHSLHSGFLARISLGVHSARLTTNVKSETLVKPGSRIAFVCNRGIPSRRVARTLAGSALLVISPSHSDGVALAARHFAGRQDNKQ